MNIPEPSISVVSLIDKHYENNAEPPRPHMGCSLLGDPCERWLWLSFRWAVVPSFTGRMLRLFQRGKDEEEKIISNLRAIGCHVTTTNKNRTQIRVDFGKHVSGSLDGIIESGIPEAPKARHVFEAKTHSLKSFKDLEKNGVEKSKPEHFIQMQAYMHGTSIERALYYAVCKDNDHIYTERVHYNKEAAEKAIERGQRLALTERMPPPISTDSTWYQCKLCSGYEFCHDFQLTKQVNCRTCAHSTPKENSTWRCELCDSDDIPVEFQRTGCESHVLHPDLVPWKLDQEASTEKEAVWIIDGKSIRNGAPDANCFASKELIANLPACLENEPVVKELRVTADARIIYSEDDIPF